jgi:hypothetical protein
MTVGFHGALCKQSVNLEQSKADDMGRQCMRAARSRCSSQRSRDGSGYELRRYASGCCCCPADVRFLSRFGSSQRSLDLRLGFRSPRVCLYANGLGSRLLRGAWLGWSLLCDCARLGLSLFQRHLCDIARFVHCHVIFVDFGVS